MRRIYNNRSALIYKQMAYAMLFILCTINTVYAAEPAFDLLSLRDAKEVVLHVHDKNTEETHTVPFEMNIVEHSFMSELGATSRGTFVVALVFFLFMSLSQQVEEATKKQQAIIDADKRKRNRVHHGRAFEGIVNRMRKLENSKEWTDESARELDALTYELDRLMMELAKNEASGLSIFGRAMLQRLFKLVERHLKSDVGMTNDTEKTVDNKTQQLEKQRILEKLSSREINDDHYEYISDILLENPGMHPSEAIKLAKIKSIEAELKRNNQSMNQYLDTP